MASGPSSFGKQELSGSAITSSSPGFSSPLWCDFEHSPLSTRVSPNPGYSLPSYKTGRSSLLSLRSSSLPKIHSRMFCTEFLPSEFNDISRALKSGSILLSEFYYSQSYNSQKKSPFDIHTTLFLSFKLIGSATVQFTNLP